MKNHKNWNPDLYLKFRDERTQPSVDLVNKINISFTPENIADIGCGPGNSSQVLLQRWPEANLIGIDSSPAMIEKAKNDYPHQQWILSDVTAYETDIKFDIVFSNATIQWIPDHKNLFDKLTSLLSDKGLIAIQLPKFIDMPVGKIISNVSQKSLWNNKTQACRELFTYNDYTYYYDLLCDKMKSIEMWQTDYIHIMQSHNSVMEWIKGAGLKPYLDALTDEKDKTDFENEILNEVVKQYPTQKNGNVLFPFKRLFFVGYK